ncbi:hypothetical protein BU24DRAFT_63204 [Aaosphaeria arxii CBS 175.79]|uniref:Uncharacterized protein n=1 Tax=Aaosphaeria arxii CBS 175.79 TaxID=1450172 RepID=A0A6A5XD05_9PLEO|nr:uncharacterized protein BU24DRAFT_63204 [Aaosphaeria arxii CBS 175.79]KAF2010687.1 hypothetical protein BU24DRAFT_63204 [Aaosphaeria arxii CBS 175.79]
MARFILATILAFGAVSQASNVCDMYGKDCTGVCNKQQIGNTPLNCNTQQGSSLRYKLDRPCSLTFYSGTNCGTVSQTFGAASEGCHNFIGTKGSWRFFC